MATEAQPTTDPAALARAYFEAVAARDLDRMQPFYAPGGVGEIHGQIELRVPEPYRSWFGALFRAFPDFEMEVIEVIAAGEKAVVRWRAAGTFSGDSVFEGVLPNGRAIEMQGCDVLTIRDGLIQRNDVYMNAADLARQLGALPPQGSAAEKAATGLVNLGTRLRRALKRSR